MSEWETEQNVLLTADSAPNFIIFWSIFNSMFNHIITFALPPPSIPFLYIWTKYCSLAIAYSASSSFIVEHLTQGNIPNNHQLTSSLVSWHSIRSSFALATTKSNLKCTPTTTTLLLWAVATLRRRRRRLHLHQSLVTDDRQQQHNPLSVYLAI